ncbi:MAG: 1-deoxy-D-xylulose-5-phosphate synthase, partial [Clostridia bacterium]|nr:1-deoxy-D-xylulose-5-phosphate synthase [Clostridia bacterium]
SGMLEDITDEKLKTMTVPELQELAQEIRVKITDTVLANGGHLASNLGLVELTIALHYVFDFPTDKVIFDVGHQCYTHKLLSGRYEDFSTLRKKGGLSGFPKREESAYDAYNTGHAGTSVSAALGIAKARDIKGGDFNVIAVIGDGSFNNGLVYEAFNSVRLLNSHFLLILNDNGMSITPTVGTMHDYLEFLEKDTQQQSKKRRHAEIFERFGFAYDGVYDGHDIAFLISKLQEIKKRLKTESIILHVLTKKGKGYVFCEKDPQATHGISPSGSEPIAAEYSQVLGKTLCGLAEKDPRIVAVTAAMTPSLGLSDFFHKFPERSVDVGICEEHASVLCAAMATQGLKPYYAIYSTFLQRAYDEIIIDICSQNLPVTLCIDRAGVVGADGETHQGIFDLSYLSPIPNLTIAVPKDVREFRDMLTASADYSGPLAIRYPREGKRLFLSSEPFVFGKWETLVKGDGRYAIFACGERAITAAYLALDTLSQQGIRPSIINARFVKPLDEALLSSLTEPEIITVEDNVCTGGLGSLVDSYFVNSPKHIRHFALRDAFIPQATVYESLEDQGITGGAIASYITDNETG